MAAKPKPPEAAPADELLPPVSDDPAELAEVAARILHTAFTDEEIAEATALADAAEARAGRPEGQAERLAVAEAVGIAEADLFAWRHYAGDDPRLVVVTVHGRKLTRRPGDAAPPEAA